MAAAGTGRSGGDSSPLTDVEIIRLAQNHQQPPSPFPSYLLSPYTYSTLISHLTSRATVSSNPSHAVSEYVIALLSLISLHSELSPLFSPLLFSYIQIFNSRQIGHDANSLRTLQFFNTLLHHLPATDVQSVVDSIACISSLSEIVCVDDAQLLDLLPKCLHLIRVSDEIERGQHFVNQLIDQVTNCVWSKGLLLKLVSLVKDFSFLDRERGKEFLEKVFEGMGRVDLQDLPSLVYQLLVMASKGFCKRQVIEGIVMFFGSNSTWSNKKSALIYRQVEGTVLLHLNFAVKQDPSLGQEVMGLVKSDFRAINHFTVAVLLSVARVKRFGDNSMAVLKKAILEVYSDHKFAKECKCLPDKLREEFTCTAKAVETSILRAVKESNYGREHIVPSIIQLAFLLLESVEDGNSKSRGSSKSLDGLLGIEELAFQILQTMFEVHEMARSEIIEQCKFRILSLKPEQSMSIVKLLGYLVKNHAYAILEYVSRLKELLDYFTFMQGYVAAYLVRSLLPLTKFSRDLLDYMILVVRKAMFRREDSIRVAAVNAVFDLIMSEKQSKTDGLFPNQDSSSQASCSQQAEAVSSMEGNLFQQLMCLLQRCLYQQANVKTIMYTGLVKLVLLEPSSTGFVFDLLFPHFLRFYKEADSQLEISKCVTSESGKLIIEEPLDRLISCISWILLLHPQNKTLSWACYGFSLSQDNEARRTLSGESCTAALLKIRNLLKAGKLDSSSVVGQKDDAASTSGAKEREKCCSLILSGITEVMLNMMVPEMETLRGSEKVALEKELIDLVEFHSSLEKIIDTSRQTSGTKRGNPRNIVQEVPGSSDSGCPGFSREQLPFLATSSILQLLETAIKLYNSGLSISQSTSQNHNSQTNLDKTSKSAKLVSFALRTSLRHIKSCSIEKGECPLKASTYGDIKVLGAPLLKLLFLLKSGLMSSNSAEKKKEARAEDQKEHFHLAVTCFKELMIVYAQHPRFTLLLEDMASVSMLEYELDSECDNSVPVDDQQIKAMDLFIVKTLWPLLSDLLTLPCHREVEMLCDTILMIGSKLPCNLRNSHGSWAHEVCKANSTKNAKVAKSVVTLAISLSSSPNDLIFAESMAAELLQVVGSETNDPKQTSTSHPIINKSTSSAISSCILQHVEASVSDIDWSVKKLKAWSLATQKRTYLMQEGETAADVAVLFEENLYSRSEAVVKVLSSFVLMSLKDAQAEQLLRLLGRFYKHMGQVSKLKIAPRGCKQLLPGLKFEKLVELTCTRLTNPLYNFVANVQKEQQENANSKGLIGKIKRENKCIPDLIFWIEDYEKHLIRLSKVTKVNLLRHAKRSTVRDFKILEPVEAEEEAMAVADEEEEEGDVADHNNFNSNRSESGSHDDDNDDDGDSVSGGEGNAGDDGEEGDSNTNTNAAAAPEDIMVKRLKKNRVVMDSDDDDNQNEN